MVGRSTLRASTICPSRAWRGHSIAGKAVCDDALMIDLTLMKGIMSICPADGARS